MATEKRMLQDIVKKLRTSYPEKGDALEIIISSIWEDLPDDNKLQESISTFCDTAIYAYDKLNEISVDMTDLECVQWHMAHFFELFDDDGNYIA